MKKNKFTLSNIAKIIEESPTYQSYTWRIEYFDSEELECAISMPIFVNNQALLANEICDKLRCYFFVKEANIAQPRATVMFYL